MDVTCRCERKSEYVWEEEPWDTYAHCGCGASHQVDLDWWQGDPCIRTRVTLWEGRS